MDEDTEAVVRRTIQLFRDIANEHAHNQLRLDSLYHEVDALNQRQTHLQQMANRCYSTADLFGFDLASELAKAPTMPPALQREFDAVAEMASSENPKSQTVKEFILDRARIAFPNPVRASQLKRAYEDATGRQVHSKTFGMSLYRLSQEGGMRREGHQDWYFVPEDQRHASGRVAIEHSNDAT
ncbi:MAG: hypothetical protein SGJ23_10860 [Alphaproteobacteria bacterium]|nr:hypothetical protein [Alphaproteobacteria bacterium]